MPLWISGANRLGQQLPEVNVVVAVVITLTLVPVALAQRHRHAAPLSGRYRRFRRGSRGVGVAVTAGRRRRREGVTVVCCCGSRSKLCNAHDEAF